MKYLLHRKGIKWFKKILLNKYFKKEIKHERLFKFLSDNEIAYDIKNYRLANPGIRIWTGPTIKKNDLIALTNWLDWCFNKFK